MPSEIVGTPAYSQRGREERPGFLPSLEISRGIAALMVALLHCGQATYLNGTGQTVGLISSQKTGSPLSEQVMRVLGNGHGAVIFFFVLSGFVLTLMLQRGDQRGVAAAWRFFSGRVFRIYPAVISTLAIFAAVFAVSGRAFAAPDNYSAFNMLMNALLLRTDIDGVMWSLQLEMIAAPLIFVAYLAFRRWGGRILIALAIVLCALSFVGGWNRIIASPNGIGPLYCFVAGMAACAAGRALRDNPRAAIGWLIGGVCAFALARPLLGWWSNWSVVAETAAASAIVAVLGNGRMAWPNARPLAQLLRFYGRISYSFYLLHPLSLLVIWQLQGPLTAAIAAGWSPLFLAAGLFVASTAAMTPLAWLQNIWVERSGIRLGHRLSEAVLRRRAGVIEQAAS